MSRRIRATRLSSHRGAIIVMAAVLITILLGMVAFGLDLGLVVLVRTQLQAAADSAAMAGAASMGLPRDQMVAVAQEFAAYHKAGGREVNLLASDIEYGTWDATVRQFTSSNTPGNAIRVTTRVDESTGGEAAMFFGRVFGRMSFSQRASAVAMANPRDIAFVVDLSGSMNDDTEPCWSTPEINRIFGSEGYPNIGNELMQQVYEDFNFGVFPGLQEHIGQFAGIVNNQNTYANLTKDNGPLTASSVPAQYRIRSTDNESTRKTKAYSAIIDYQLARLMPNALPPPTVQNYAYWEKYIDYVCRWTTVSGRGTLPPGQDRNRVVTGFNNPNRDTYPRAGNASAYQNMLGYRTYVQFMMDHGRDEPVVGNQYAPISVHSPYCPWHPESTAGGTFVFPPREQPTHAARRAMIAAMQVVKERNASIPDHQQRDWVSIIGFDTLTSGGPVIEQPLTGDYDAAMLVSTRLQAVADLRASTSTETGLIVAREHLAPESEGGAGRRQTNKIVVLLTDGVPNLYSSSRSEIDRYISDNPNPDFYSGGAYAFNGPLMQAGQMQTGRWQLFPVGLGLGTDYGFMDRMARMGGTANDNGQSPRGSGNPAEYERRLTEIFEEIITSPQVRLVQ
ncbi:MAG: pilus assembly protein TadG-related protein [Thermoguttaceae bacterium]|jgi:Flp pilus assembly protein TadG|nr:pilus assembly protein TadG-related protein [Thermoguttaceae bacterium]